MTDKQEKGGANDKEKNKTKNVQLRVITRQQLNFSQSAFTHQLQFKSSNIYFSQFAEYTCNIEIYKRFIRDFAGQGN